MSTELQRQVATIKKQHIQVQSVKQGLPSIFLSAKDAAGVDIQDVLEAALTGLKLLSQYDDRFKAFGSTLLHPASVDIQRELKTKEVS